MEKKKGLWARMQEEGNKVVIDLSKPMSLEEMAEGWKLMAKRDRERRERLDKEYTDISNVTREEVDKVITDYGGIDNIPNGLFAKVKIAGSYMDMPVKMLHQWQEAIHEEWIKHQNNAEEKPTTENR